MRRSLIVCWTCLSVLLGCADESDGLLSLTDAARLDSLPASPDAGGDATPYDTNSGFRVETLVDDVSLTIRGSVARLDFEVPDDVVSLAVMIQGEASGWYGIDSWLDGDGSHLVVADWPGLAGNERGCFTCRNFATQGQGVSTTIAPNRDSGLVSPGQHQLEMVGWVDGFAADALRTTVIVKRGPRVPESGVLDLNFYFTGAQGWTSDSVQGDAYFAACVQRVAQLFERVGVRLGELNYIDLEPGLEVVSIAEEEDTLGALVARSVTEYADGLNIFFVDQILTGDSEFPDIPGVSASVPNPPYLQGTVASGVVVATKGPLEVPPGQRFLDPPAIGQTMAHELGHALGLFHTSEYDEVSHDHFADTPENDNTYLMHADGTGTRISPEQARAVLANPVIRHP